MMEGTRFAHAEERLGWRGNAGERHDTDGGARGLQAG
jgi:hypothetical protein